MNEKIRLKEQPSTHHPVSPTARLSLCVWGTSPRWWGRSLAQRSSGKIGWWGRSFQRHHPPPLPACTLAGCRLARRWSPSPTRRRRWRWEVGCKVADTPGWEMEERGKGREGIEKKWIDNREGREQTGRTRQSCFFITMETTDHKQKDGKKKKQYKPKRVFRILSGHKLSQLGDSYFIVRKQAKWKQHMASC